MLDTNQIPPEMVADIWREIAAKQELSAEARADLIRETAEPLIAKERQRYIDDLLELDEYEQRVETILAGGPLWWEDR